MKSNPTPTLSPSGALGSVAAKPSFVPGRAAREEILHRAYALWEREGWPTDRKLANWLEAEKEILPHQANPAEAGAR